MVAPVLVCCGIFYNLLAVVALLRFRSQSGTSSRFTPAVSILKPVRGRDARFYEAIRSHAELAYPNFEILFGIADPADPALRDIARLEAEFPNIPIRMVNTANDAPNGKSGSLEILARDARFDVLVVNDADILVERDYLRRVIAPLEDQAVGLVTCLYRGEASSWAAKAEALGIVTEFAPSILVARLLSNSGFALGSTMAFRRSSLDGIGGFAVLRNYLADDYQLGARISAAGGKVLLVDTVVETSLGAGSLREVWKHQVRWSRTIRVSRPAGYFGYLTTQLSFWSAVALIAGYPVAAAAGIGTRLIEAAVALGKLDRGKFGLLPFVPLRDLFGTAVWIAGMGGSEVEWRGIRFRLFKDGTIRPAR